MKQELKNLAEKFKINAKKQKQKQKHSTILFNFLHNGFE